MEAARRGAEALEASDSAGAVSHYTRALIEHPTSPDYFTQRSTAFSRLKPPRHDLALHDAEYAVLLGQKRQKREKIQAGQQRRVVSLYGLGRHEEAKHVLDSMLKWRAKDNKKDKMEHDMWMARIEGKLKGKNIEDKPVEGFKEYPEIDLPTEDAMKTWLRGQLNVGGTFKFEIGLDADATTPAQPTTRTNGLDADNEADVKAAKAEMAGFAPATTQAPTQVLPVRHDWYQDNNNVMVSFYAKKVDKTQVQTQFADDHIELSFPHPGDPTQTFSFALNPTYANIDPAATVLKVMGTKVELKIAKQEKGIKWPALADTGRPKVDKLPSAWTTKGDQDWDKKAAELTKKKPKKKDEGDKNGGDDSDSDAGGDAVDGFFKKLYAGADDDTRRAMMKSFQESNGTALSTNWSEVSKGKVEEVKSKSD